MPDADRPRRWYRPRNIVLALLVSIVLVVGWALVELRRVYTDAPDPADEYRAALIALCAAGQPEGENGWPLLARVLERLGSTAEDVRRDRRRAGDPDGADAAAMAAMDAELDAPGRLADLRRALAMPRHVRPWASEGLLFNETLPLLRPARDLGDVLAERARAAAARSDWAAAIDFVGLAIRLGDVTARQPSLMHALSGAAIHMRALKVTREMLDDHVVPAEFAKEIVALVGTIDDPSIARRIEIGRLETRQALHWTHGSRGYALPLTTLFDSSVMSGMVFMSPIDPVNDERSIGRAALARLFLAPRDECGALADRWFSALEKQAELPLATRWDTWPEPGLMAEIRRPRYALLALFLPTLDGAIDSSDVVVVERRATLLMAVIEQYQERHGTPPGSLDKLVPDWIESVPTDPIHGGEFGYEVRTDASGVRSFVLYSFGSDGVDDGGQFESVPYEQRSYRTEAGTDVPFN